MFLESKVGESVSANPELHPMLEDLERIRVYMKLRWRWVLNPIFQEHGKRT